MATPDRPKRLRVQDESGRMRTLDAGNDAFVRLGSGAEPIFLGLGPDPGLAAALLPATVSAAYLECPAFAAAMPASWQAAIPAHWRALSPEALTAERAARAHFYLYRHNPRLFPSFWGPLLARIQLARLPARAPGASRHATAGTVLLAKPQGGLLEPELACALRALGHPVRTIAPETAREALVAALATEQAAVYLCINGSGLDPDGLTASLLAEAGIPVALWCVDNPFHVLSRFRAPFWKTLHLFVTDDWFLEPLRALGAISVHHLPLAASRHFLAARPAADLADQAVFVGRSTFPGREQFFAGCRLPDALFAEAQNRLAAGQRPDFGWWLHALGLRLAWPDKTVRQAGYGAEMTGQAWRTLCLNALAQAMPLTIHGDDGWRRLVPEARLRGPIDYYRELPSVYAGASVTVNLTSPLLPRGLTQRHFDAWAAGGLLITDATPGLDLFPTTLTRPITFDRPEAIGPLVRALARNKALRRALVADWQVLIAAHHTYEHRLRQLLQITHPAHRA